MEQEKEKTTVPYPSVGADGGQSLSKVTTQSIAENFAEHNPSEKNWEEVMRQISRVSDPAYLPTLSMNALYEQIYPGKLPVIENLLYPGTYLFVGAPKVGKSFLMAQLAYHVSVGCPLWGYTVRQGVVLYLALEDDYPRLQERFYRMFGERCATGLYLSVNAHTLNGGLEKQLEGFIHEHPDTRLIIIDTLQKIREDGGEKYSYASDYEVITRLKRFADTSGVCLLLVHHTRKQQADDRFDKISGTNGLLGAADGAFLLQKERRTEHTATLDISGRDQQDQRLYLRRDEERLVWELERAETEPHKEPPDPVLEAIAAFITVEQPSWNGTATELVAALGVNIKANALAMRLNVRAGRLFHEYHIRYESLRNHAGRSILLTLEPPPA